MNEININEIVKVESLGVIKQQLDKVESFIDDKIKDIPKVLEQLEKMTDEQKEEKKGEIKKYKTYLSSIKNQLEDKRKEIKTEINKPYKDFEDYYSNGVKIKLEESIEQLNNVVNDIESKQNKEKEEELREFANQHFITNGIQDIVKFEDIGLKINISSSVKSLKEQILDFVNKVVEDLKLIDMDEYKEEILIEYLKTLDYGKSKMEVNFRHRQMEQIMLKQATEKEQEKQEEKVVEKVEEAIEEVKPPVEIIENDELITVSFTITDTKEKIIKLRDYLKENGINYE